MTETERARDVRVDRWIVAAAMIAGLALRIAAARAPGIAFDDVGVSGPRHGGAVAFATELVAWFGTTAVLYHAGRCRAALFALAIGAFDPLQIVAASGTGRSTACALAGLGAFAVACGRGLPVRLAGGALVVVMPLLRIDDALFPDPWPLAWSDDPRIGAWCAALDAFGWTALVLASFGLVRSQLGARPLIALALAILVVRGVPARLVDGVALAPTLVACAALTLTAVAERSAGAARALLALAVLTVLPSLASDARGGLRLPVASVAARFPGPERATTTFESPTPELFEGSGLTVRPLDLATLPASDPGAGPARVVLIAVMNERACAAPQSVLDDVEARTAPAFEVRVPRFDLYRAEIRAYRFGAARR